MQDSDARTKDNGILLPSSILKCICRDPNFDGSKSTSVNAQKSVRKPR